MGWRGVVRSMASAARAAERDAIRRRKLQIKQQISDLAAEAVAEWEAHLDDIVSIHTDLTDALDWQQIATKPRPAAPSLMTPKADEASRRIREYKPGLFDFLQGGAEKIRARLRTTLEQAEAADRRAAEDAQAAYEAAVVDWQTDVEFANRIIKREPDAIKELLEETRSLAAEGMVGSRIEFSISESHLTAIVDVHSDEIVPKVRRKQLASGKLSETKMPVGEFNDLYQDYVASAAIKVAGDLFHTLPFDELVITCQTTMLNPTTGHLEATPVLSVKFVRPTFTQLNLQAIDPSDAMKNFLHVMKYSRTKGFSRVEPLSP